MWSWRPTGVTEADGTDCALTFSSAGELGGNPCQGSALCALPGAETRVQIGASGRGSGQSFWGTKPWSDALLGLRDRSDTGLGAAVRTGNAKAIF